MFDADLDGRGDQLQTDPVGLERLSTDRLEEEITELAARIAAATCQWMLLVAEYDRRRGYEEWGFDCCARWLAWRCSIVPRSAREHVRVARSLTELDRIRGAFSRGELTYSKVRALTRVAGPETEEDLLELARHATAAQLERVSGAYRRAMNVEAAEDAHERRYLTYCWEPDGSLSLHGNIPAEDGALLLRALEAGREGLRDQEGDETGSSGAAEGGSAEPPRVRGPVNADALVLMAETLLAHGAAARPGGERSQVVVHVDSTALSGDQAGDHRAVLEDGPPICAETARRLSCDASRVTMLDGAEGPLHVGRKTRTVPPAMRRALRSRDGGCRFPGCTHRRWTDNHHIRHWSKGGETSMANLVELCRRHHRLVHEGGFGVDRDPSGELRFWRPDGELIPAAPCPGERRSRPDRRRGHSLPAVPGSPVPLSAGERMDLDLAVTTLASRSPRSARGP